MSPMVKSYGTLGCFASDVTGAQWLLTATHVLSNSAPVANSSFQVFQPDYRLLYGVIADGKEWRVDATSQVIAVAIRPDIACVRNMLGLGDWNGVAAPSVGTKVVKVGAATGITSGTILSVQANTFSVAPLPDVPPGFALAAGGDSGAAWFDLTTHAIVGIHQGQSADGRAQAVRADVALATLKLSCT